MVLGMLLAWSLAAGGGGDRWAVPVSAWVKVRPGVRVQALSAVDLLAARGECEGFQVLAWPPAEAVEISAAPLRGPGGALPVSLFREAFVMVRTPSNAQGAPGLWPDPLVPVEVSPPSDPDFCEQV